MIFQVLCKEESGSSLEEKSEAAGLLAQITSPWLDPPEASTDGDTVNSQWPTLNLTPYVSAFIAALTGKIPHTPQLVESIFHTRIFRKKTCTHWQRWNDEREKEKKNQLTALEPPRWNLKKLNFKHLKMTRLVASGRKDKMAAGGTAS